MQAYEMTEIRIDKVGAATKQIELAIRLLFQNEDPIGTEGYSYPLEAQRVPPSGKLRPWSPPRRLGLWCWFTTQRIEWYSQDTGFWTKCLYMVCAGNAVKFMVTRYRSTITYVFFTITDLSNNYAVHDFRRRNIDQVYQSRARTLKPISCGLPIKAM